MKRFFDLIVSLCILVIFSPLIFLIIILIKLKLGSPIVFKQKRPGLHGKPFTIYKFRSMTDECDENGELFPDEERLTSFGKFLRKFSLDELPQIFNVIKGDLSLVGPRPLAIEYLPLYSSFQARRHEVKPGITGWAQINGRNNISWERKFELDVWYVDNRSLFLDMKIILLTIKKVIFFEGISQDGHVTMPDFEGSKNNDVNEIS